MFNCRFGIKQTKLWRGTLSAAAPGDYDLELVKRHEMHNARGIIKLWQSSPMGILKQCPDATTSKEAVDYFKSTLTYQQRGRSAIDQILKHPFVKRGEEVARQLESATERQGLLKRVLLEAQRLNPNLPMAM